MMADRLRYAIHNCQSIDMDNYMLTRNVEPGAGGPASDEEYWVISVSGLPHILQQVRTVAYLYLWQDMDMYLTV